MHKRLFPGRQAGGVDSIRGTLYNKSGQMMKEARRRPSGNTGAESGGAVKQMDLSALQVSISHITCGKDNIRGALMIPALKTAEHDKRSASFFLQCVRHDPGRRQPLFENLHIRD